MRGLLLALLFSLPVITSAQVQAWVPPCNVLGAPGCINLSPHPTVLLMSPYQVQPLPPMPASPSIDIEPAFTPASIWTPPIPQPPPFADNLLSRLQAMNAKESTSTETETPTYNAPPPTYTPLEQTPDYQANYQIGQAIGAGLGNIIASARYRHHQRKLAEVVQAAHSAFDPAKFLLSQKAARDPDGLVLNRDALAIQTLEQMMFIQSFYASALQQNSVVEAKKDLAGWKEQRDQFCRLEPTYNYRDLYGNTKTCK